MYTADNIAKWFLAKTNQERIETELDEHDVYEGITHLKLQKLLYYAQGIHLSLFNERLFDEDILAWAHGPVVQSVYDSYKKFGSSQISYDMSDTDATILNNIECNFKAKTTLELTYNNFSIYTAWQLRNMTHQEGSPWDNTVNINGLNSIIKDDLIKDYFDSEVIDNG